MGLLYYFAPLGIKLKLCYPCESVMIRGNFLMTTSTRTNPLSYLTDQLNELKAKGTHFKLRVLED